MSLALARKYRPRTFAGVAVQSHVSDTLRGAIARGRVAHGYLLCGPRGTGKTTLARVLAMALNCENKSPDGEPCGECTSCQRIWSGSSSLDVVEIDAASNRGVDDARELRERAMYAPSGDDRYKVYIVDEAHMLTREAWNALLKILEEPPPRVVFVFATTDPQKIAQAAAPVLSRLQRFDLKRISLTEITRRLEHVLGEEKIAATPESLAMIARAADGSMRDALSLTDQVISIGEGGITADRVREALGLVPEDEYLGVIAIIAERRAGDVFGTVARLADGGVDFGVFLSGLGDMLRAQLAVILDGKVEGLSPSAREALESHRAEFSAGDLLRMLTMLSAIEPQFRRSTQQQLLVEMLLVRFALLDRSVSLEEVLQTLGGSRPQGVATASAFSAPARARPLQTESRAAPRPPAAVAPQRADVPAEAVRTPPTPPLRVTPPSPQAPVDWKAELEQTANSTSRPARLTTEAVREERLRMLRAQDPVLDAAVRELDLDLKD
jgi:DNA polymerase-3 subunit gamma/tau